MALSRWAARAITRIYDQALEPCGLKVNQYSLLANIMDAGPLNTSQLARILNLDRTTLVRNLKALEGCGLVENRATDDPRERQIAISEAGQKVVETATPHWQGVQRRLRDRFGRELLDLLAGLATELEALAGEDEAIETRSHGATV